MSRRLPVASLASVLLLLASCKDPTIPEGVFWAQRASVSDDSWYMVDAELMAEGARSRVYVEHDYLDQVGPAEAAAIAAEFDDHVYGSVRTTFGAESDVDADGKITILILDIVDDYVPGGSYVAGYFHPVNLFSKESYPQSNEREMLYMDCSPGIPGNGTFNLTMAHEFQHLVNFNQKVFVQGTIGQDTWINEGLSNAAEYVYRRDRGDSPAHVVSKIQRYNDDPTDLLAQGYSFLTWFGLYENYVAGYLFFQWLRIHTGVDPADDGIYRDLIESSYGDYRAVAEQPDVLAIGDWQTVVRSWYAANLFYDPTGIFGYENDLPVLLIAPRLSDVTGYEPGDATLLYPGEGVYWDVTSPTAMTPDSAIDYAGLNESSSAVDADPAGGYAGNVLLAYNRDGNDTATYEPTGAFPAVAAPTAAPVSAARAAASAPSEPVPIDVLPGLNGMPRGRFLGGRTGGTPIDRRVPAR